MCVCVSVCVCVCVSVCVCVLFGGKMMTCKKLSLNCLFSQLSLEIFDLTDGK